MRVQIYTNEEFVSDIRNCISGENYALGNMSARASAKTVIA